MVRCYWRALKNQEGTKFLCTLTNSVRNIYEKVGAQNFNIFRKSGVWNTIGESCWGYETFGRTPEGGTKHFRVSQKNAPDRLCRVKMNSPNSISKNFSKIIDFFKILLYQMIAQTKRKSKHVFSGWVSSFSSAFSKIVNQFRGSDKNGVTL